MAAEFFSYFPFSKHILWFGFQQQQNRCSGTSLGAGSHPVARRQVALETSEKFSVEEWKIKLQEQRPPLLRHGTAARCSAST